MVRSLGPVNAWHPGDGGKMGTIYDYMGLCRIYAGFMWDLVGFKRNTGFLQVR